MFTKYQALKSIFVDLNLDSKVISLEELLNIISKPNYNLKDDIGCASSTVNRILNKLAPNRIKGERLCVYLFRVNDLKLCPQCGLVKPVSYFSKNRAKISGLQTNCKDCSTDYFSKYYPSYYRDNKDKYAAAKIKYMLRLKEASPKWANLAAIKEIYKKCPEGFHVDHYYPLQGETVCGLHVETNLQYLPARDNISKGNKMPTQPETERLQ